MKIGYFASVAYRHNSPIGGYAHIRQFVTLASEMGHELLLMHGGEHPNPNIKRAPKGRWSRFNALRGVDCLYYRVEYKAPRDVKWIMPVRRSLIGSPKVVWEFNSVPEYARVVGDHAGSVEQHIADLRHFGRHCDLALCVSQSISDYVKEKIGIANVRTVENGSDPTLFTPEAQPLKRVLRHPGRLNVVWIGSAEVKWHNFDLLREAAWLLWDNGNPVVDFHLIGAGMHGMRDLPANVHYQGPEEYEKLPNWLTAMDVGLNVYRAGAASYSCPLKLFDYMACGLTPVSTDQPQARKIFEDLGQADLIVPTDNPKALAEVLRKLAADPQRVQKQGAAARALAVSYYNWRRAVTDTLNAIQALGVKA